MKQPDFKARKAYHEIVEDLPTSVCIPGTRRKVKIRGMKPYTIERLTALWLERDASSVPESSSETLRSMCTEPYFSVREACLIVLNSYWRIRLLYPLMWRIWGRWIGYTEEQMSPIIEEGKKKLPLAAHWRNMAFSTDMRTDWMKMTAKEAEQYRAELLSAAKALSSRSSPSTGGQGGSSSGSSPSGTGDTGAS